MGHESDAAAAWRTVEVVGVERAAVAFVLAVLLNVAVHAFYNGRATAQPA